jgi:hypothetical protein
MSGFAIAWRSWYDLNALRLQKSINLIDNIGVKSHVLVAVLVPIHLAGTVVAARFVRVLCCDFSN